MESGPDVTQGAYNSARPAAVVTFGEIVRRLQEVPVDRLEAVYEFITRQTEASVDDAFGCAIASEPVLARDWDTPEEDAAWANL